MARRKSLEQRRAVANARVGSALAQFEVAVQALDEAAAEHQAVVNDIADQVNELTLLQAKADRDYQDAARVAEKLRSLIS